MEELLERMLEECRHFAEQGRVADYIPELAKGDPAALGVYIIGSEGRHSWAGDCRQPFTLQSIVKPILLLQALLYNGSGEFALRVGVPAKSGVGGGIMAVVPTRMGIGIYGPALDRKGNSVAGIQLLERLSKELYLSIF